jgi:hypothetical protein
MSTTSTTKTTKRTTILDRAKSWFDKATLSGTPTERILSAFVAGYKVRAAQATRDEKAIYEQGWKDARRHERRDRVD